MEKKKTYWKWLMVIWAVMILINIIAWCSTAFCDFYVENIFPIWVSTYGRFTGLFPVSIGEWLLYLAVLYILISLLLLPFGIAFRAKKTGKWIQRWLLTVPGMVTFVCVIMTLNCTILYHCSPVESRMTTHKSSSLEELLQLREYLVVQCNELSKQMLRDENGYIVYNGDMKEQAIEAMRGLSDSFPRLSGYYPRPKPLYASWFFSQQYTCGYYFPFSMEANYNDMMYIMNKPASMCHELAHLKGYIYEDEANFLAYLACVESGNDFFAYSGYLSVLYYVEEDVREALAAAGDTDRYETLTPIEEQVRADNCFLTKEAWEKVEEVSIFDTKTVSDAADVFLETNLNLNGISEGIESYSRVVELLLLYYD